MKVLQEGQKHIVELTLNGEPVDGYAEPRTLLSDFLRHEIGATGTHVGCEHGVCGACTVIMDGKAVRSCLTLAVQAEGRDVRTIEGLASEDHAFGPLQQAFHENFALQCGYCTPGMLMTLTELMESGKSYAEADVRLALSGNICRCTGYKEIVDAAMAALARQGAAKTEQA